MNSTEALNAMNQSTRSFLIVGLVLAVACLETVPAYGAAKQKKRDAATADRTGRVQTPPPTSPPLRPVDITKLPAGVERLDLFLLMGQSNMKGRGVMPDEPKRDPRLVMMHMRDDQWYLARHPLHLVGDARTFEGADNAGVGPGLSFAEVLSGREPGVRIGLIPCAVGGSSINLWAKGAKLYDEALRRARLALQTTLPVKARIRGVLWLQGEADATDTGMVAHEAKLLKLVDDLRADLAIPDLPFIACTIAELRPDAEGQKKAEMNRLLLSLPSQRPYTACVDARDLKGHIGDNVHYDTESQTAIGQRFAMKYFELTAAPSAGEGLSFHPAADAPGFVPLFNGKDLSGWQTTGNWIVEADGSITLYPREGETGWKRFDAYLSTTRKYADFVLDLEFKFEPKGNSGVFMRVGDLKDHVTSGFEVQILDTYGLQNPGHHDCGGIVRVAGPSKNMVKPAGEWNRYTMTVKGRRVTVVFNGEQVIDINFDDTVKKDLPNEGYIAFQDEAKRVAYRNVRIKELK